MIRFRDLLQGTKLFPRIELITVDSMDNFLRELGKNDFYHSKNIEKILDSMVPDNIKSDSNIFDLGEIFLLLVAIYLHDIGRKTNPCHHELESYNQIRKSYGTFHLNEFEANAVAQICAAHASEAEWPIGRNDSNYGIMDLMFSGRTSNLQRLGALLRIGDELDNTFVRTRGIITEEGSIRNIIRCVSPNVETGYIEIQSEPKTWSEFETLQMVREYTQKRLEETIPYLREMGLPYYQIWLSPSSFTAPIKTDFSSKPIDTILCKVIPFLESRYSKVELYEKIDGIELPIVCKNKFLGIEEITGILITDMLTIEQTLEFTGVLNSLLKKRIIDIGLVISNFPIDINQKSTLVSKGIKVITFDELFYNLFEFDKFMEFNIHSYEKCDIFYKNLYIKSSASSGDGNKIHEFEDYIIEWTTEDEGSQLTIIGDFGLGKTTLMEKINYECSKLAIRNKNKRIPILIKLKELSNYTSIDKLIIDKLNNNIVGKIDFEAFQMLNRAGRFIILLDGFDEIPNLHSEDNVIKSFRNIDVIVEPRSKVILTCRTHFFKSNEQMFSIQEGTKLYDQIKNKSGYQLYSIDNFSQEQINEYVKNWAKEDYALYMNIIESIYNLSDLANRPVLLNLIVKTIPQLHKIKDAIINSSSLYRTYIRYWLDRDDWRTKMKLTDRAIISTELAHFFFLNDIKTIHYKNLNDIFSGKLHSKINYDNDLIDFELRTCNFLKRDSLGYYSFVHVSFQEFLLAQLFVERFLNIDTPLPNWILPSELKRNSKQKRVASNETEFFFIQTMELEIQNSNLIEEKLISLTNDIRKCFIIVSIIENLEPLFMGKLLVNILVTQKWNSDANILVNAIIKSYEIERSLEYLESTIDKNADLSFINYTINLFEINLQDTSILRSIKEKTKKLELTNLDKQIDISDLKTTINDYPFSRDRYKLTMQESLKLEDFFDKPRFDRQWKRAKAEYDQRIKREKKNNTP